MQHCDPTTLALVGIGEVPASEQDAEHLRSCAQCQAEVASFARVATVGRSITVEDQPVEPPASVWDNIQAQVSAKPTEDIVDTESGTKTASGSDPDPGTSAVGVTADEPTSIEDFSKRGERGKRGKRSKWLPLVAAAAVGALLGGSVIAGVVAQNDAKQAPAVLASGALAPLPDGADQQTTGKARLERAGDQYVLQVSAAQLPAPSGFFEVWMMNPATSGLVAVGSFNANQTEASFPLPEGLSLTEYTTVDISDEPFDGVPGHSAVSVLRGNLSA
ncbi:MAG: anti-sigma factor [Candidatus Nanopelagicales bacterium]|nr:anti-sigma factor [Candidatus Nanopelagicales bacterium]